jgi:hypothetical protein
MSCKKRPLPYEGPVFNTLIYDAKYYNLANREFIFDDLVWEIIEDDNGLTLSAFIYVLRPDPFFNPNWSYEVSIKADTSVNWINVLRAGINPSPPANSFLYNISPGRIFIYPYKANDQLRGRVSLKIKFL